MWWEKEGNSKQAKTDKANEWKSGEKNKEEEEVPLIVCDRKDW